MNSTAKIRALQLTSEAGTLSAAGKHAEAADTYEVEADAWEESETPALAEDARIDGARQRALATPPSSHATKKDNAQ